MFSGTRTVHVGADGIARELMEIPLTRGYHALVDSADYQLVSALRWHVHVDDGRAYAVGRDPSRPGRGSNTSMHRFIVGAERGQIVDHRDGDGLHNWRRNLRICTNAQNIRNGKLSSRSRTGFKGVSYLKDRCLYRAQICCQWKKINLGDYPTPEDAARVYDANARKLHGEFARLNFPLPSSPEAPAAEAR